MADTQGFTAETTTWARRVLALIVDWFASTLVVILVVGTDRWSGDAYASFYVLGVYILENAVFTTLAGGSFGKIATRLRTVRIDGNPAPLDPLRSLARSILIAVVIPPLVYRPDGRGLHDMAAGTMTVTVDTARRLQGRS